MPEKYNFTPGRNTPFSQEILDLAQAIATQFSNFPSVIAVALAGSQTSRVADNLSDLDFFIYTQLEIPLDIRTGIAREFANRIEINNQFWEPGDEWIESSSGINIDIMYRKPNWIEEQLNQVLVKHQASVGYSTKKANQPYPEPLKQAIVAKNHPILRKNISSYTHQIQLAIDRSDRISINHRTMALLASYFDIIFAINSVPHPGEKRLVEFAQQLCKKLPQNLKEDINSLVDAISIGVNQNILVRVNRLIDCLDNILIAEELISY